MRRAARRRLREQGERVEGEAYGRSAAGVIGAAGSSGSRCWRPLGDPAPQRRDAAGLGAALMARPGAVRGLRCLLTVITGRPLVRRVGRRRARRPGSPSPTRRCARRCASRSCSRRCPSCRRSSPTRSSICRSPGPALVDRRRDRRGCAAALALLVLEPPVWPPEPLSGPSAAALLIADRLLAARPPPLLGRRRRLFRGLRPSGEPAADAETLGPFAMLLVHCAIARDERAGAAARRSAAPALSSARGAQQGARSCVVQCELFFDARRLSPLIPPAMLSGFAECCATAAMSWRARRAGLGRQHDARRIRRADRHPGKRTRLRPLQPVLRAGARADRLAGLAAAPGRLPHDLPAPVRPPLLPPRPGDAGARLRAVSRPREPRRLAERRPTSPTRNSPARSCACSTTRGRDTFIFAITMGNHGPWLRNGPPVDPDDRRAASTRRRCRDGDELLRYLDGLRRSDEMLRILMDGLERARRDRRCWRFYGDHLPSLPHAFEHFGFAELHSDYVIWPRHWRRRRGGTCRSHGSAGIVDRALAPAGRCGDRRPAALATRRRAAGSAR